MVELRKRKTPPPVPEKASKKSTTSKVTSLLKGKKKNDEAKEKEPEPVPESKPEPEAEAPAAAPAATKPKASGGALAVGDKLDLASLGGTVQLNDGTETTLGKLAEQSTSGVIVFTYPKANTPGCTKQACLFRDSNTTIESAGYSVYGLSLDSPKANSSFQTKYNLPYSLICDVKGTLIKELGFRKSPSGTQRGVAVIDKDGTVQVWLAGGPDATLEAVLPLLKKDATEAS